MCFFIFAIPEKLCASPFHGSQCLKHLDALRFAVTKTAFTYKNYAGLPKLRGLHQQRKGGLNHGLPIFHGGKWWFNHVENHQTIWGCLVVISHKSLWGAPSYMPRTGKTLLQLMRFRPMRFRQFVSLKLLGQLLGLSWGICWWQAQNS
jgi:hypothetical protein